MSLRLAALLGPGSSHRFERNNLCLLLTFGFQFTRCWTSGRWYVGQSFDQFLVQFNTLCDQDCLVLRQGNKFEHMHEIGLPLNKLLFQGVLGSVERTASAGHAVRALCPEGIRAKSVTEVVIFPGLTPRSRARKHCFLIQEHFDGRQILFQIPCLYYFAGKLGGIDEKIALCRRKILVPQVPFDLEKPTGCATRLRQSLF